MARVTVEDCLKNVKNRFELVLIASKRARQLMRGKEAKVDWDNDKATVVALREIAEGYVNFDTPTQEEQETAAMLHSLNANSLAKEQQKAAEKAAAEASLATDEDDMDEEDELDTLSETPASIETLIVDEPEHGSEENKEPDQE